MTRRSEIRRLLEDIREGRRKASGRTPKVYAGIDPTTFPGLPDDLDRDTGRVKVLDGGESVADVAGGSQTVGWSDPDADEGGDTIRDAEDTGAEK